MKLPKMSSSQEKQHIVTDVFEGLTLTDGAKESEFTDMLNLSSSRYPALSVRAPRLKYRECGNIDGMCVTDHPIWVSSGKLYYNGEELEGLTLTTGKKSLVSAGKKVYIFPDKIWFDTESFEHGSMERSVSTDFAAVVITPALRAYSDAEIIQSSSQPEFEKAEDFEGKFWLDSASVPCKLKKYVYNGQEGSFVEVVPDCVRLVVANTDGSVMDSFYEGFEAGDGLTLSGSGQMETTLSALGLLSTFVLLENGQIGSSRYMILDAKITGHRTQILTKNEAFGSFTVTRRVPDLDAAFFCQNRIWGYSSSENRIFCSRKNALCSWYGSSSSLDDACSLEAGTPGEFTACASFADTPLFFKEEYLHKIIGTSQNVIKCRGVRRGCAGSVCVVGDRLYYKSGSQICSYNGSSFSVISEKLGVLDQEEACGGVLGSKYYISLSGIGYESYVYVYDTVRKLWHKEDGPHFTHSVTCKEKIYTVSEGAVWEWGEQSSADSKDDICWFAESGDFQVKNGDRKALSRIVIRCRLAEKAHMNVYVMYDNDGNYVFVGRGEGRLSSIPLLPRRCDSLRIRLEGKGECVITSLVRTYSKASII